MRPSSFLALSVATLAVSCSSFTSATSKLIAERSDKIPKYHHRLLREDGDHEERGPPTAEEGVKGVEAATNAAHEAGVLNTEEGALTNNAKAFLKQQEEASTSGTKHDDAGTLIAKNHQDEAATHAAPIAVSNPGHESTTRGINGHPTSEYHPTGTTGAAAETLKSDDAAASELASEEHVDGHVKPAGGESKKSTPSVAKETEKPIKFDKKAVKKLEKMGVNADDLAQGKISELKKYMELSLKRGFFDKTIMDWCVYGFGLAAVLVIIFLLSNRHQQPIASTPTLDSSA